MHELRARLQGLGPKLIVDKASARRGSEDALSVQMIRRSEVRRSDNRTEGRQRLEHEQVLVELEGRSVPLSLINLSPGGAMLEGNFQFNLFSKVILVLPGDHRVGCVVRWMKGDRVGLEFGAGTNVQLSDEEHRELVRSVIAKTFPGFDLAQLETKREQAPHDRAPRQTLTWTATLIHGVRSTPVRLRNVSSTGALIETGLELSPGAEVALDLGPAGVIDSEVVWAFCDQAGLRFSRAFNLQLLGLATPQVVTGEDEAVDLDQLSNDELQSFLEGYMKY